MAVHPAVMVREDPEPPEVAEVVSEVATILRPKYKQLSDKIASMLVRELEPEVGLSVMKILMKKRASVVEREYIQRPDPHGDMHQCAVIDAMLELED